MNTRNRANIARTFLITLISCFLPLSIAHAGKSEVLRDQKSLSERIEEFPLTAREVSQLLENAYSRIVIRDFLGAEDLLLQARRTDPFNHWIALNLGLIYLNTDRPNLAEIEYRRVRNVAVPTNEFFSTLLNERFDETSPKKSPATLRKLGELRAAWKAGPKRPNQPFAAIVPIENETSSESASSTVTPGASCTAQSALGHVQVWANAWREMDVYRYIAAYTPEFKGEAASPKQWRNVRRNSILGAKRIDLRLERLNVRMVEKSCEATAEFKQIYRSAQFTDQGTKTLRLRWQGKDWRIFRESFTRETDLQSDAASKRKTSANTSA